MILVDTNILSTFSKIGKLELLYEAFNTDFFYISPNVHDELVNAKRKGYNFVAPILNLIEEKRIKIIAMTPEENLKINNLPESFSKGEKDSIVVCRERKGIMVTNEKKVINYCKKEKIVCFDLIDVLQALRQFTNYSKERVNDLIEEIEKKDNIIFKDKDNMVY